MWPDGHLLYLTSPSRGDRHLTNLDHPDEACPSQADSPTPRDPFIFEHLGKSPPDEEGCQHRLRESRRHAGRPFLCCAHLGGEVILRGRPAGDSGKGRPRPIAGAAVSWCSGIICRPCSARSALVVSRFCQAAPGPGPISGPLAALHPMLPSLPPPLPPARPARPVSLCPADSSANLQGEHQRSGGPFESPHPPGYSERNPSNFAWIKPAVHFHGQLLHGCQQGASVRTRNPPAGLELQIACTRNIKSHGGDLAVMAFLLL
jgi:hypothetical protein